MNLNRQTYDSQYESYKKSPMEAAASLGWKIGSGLLLNKVAGFIPTGIDVKRLKYVNQFHIGGEVWHKTVPRAFQSATIKELIWEAIKTTEEQLFKIPRVFSASSFYGTSIYSSIPEFAPKLAWLQQNYNYLHSITGGRLDKSMLRDGNIIYRNGQLLTKSGDMLLENARMMPGRWGDGIKGAYSSRMVKALFEQHGLNPSETDFIITGGKNWYKSLLERANAFSTVAIQNYVKLLDDPFELIGKGLENIGAKTPMLDELLGKGSRFLKTVLMRDQFGVGGKGFMKGGAVDLMKRHAMYGLPKLLLAYGAFRGLNSLMRATIGTDTKGAAAQAYQDISKGFAHISEKTGLTALNKWQEEKTHGLHTIPGVLALPVSLGILGGTIGGLANLAKHEPGFRAPAPYWFSDMASRLESAKGAVGKAAEWLKLGSMDRVKSFMTIGAAAGLAATAVFLPGAIGANKTPEELDRIYSGEELVPIKRGRFWEFGTSPYEGMDIEYHLPHWSVRAKTDARRAGTLPEDYYNNPIKHFFGRLFDPYAVEKKLDEERPYTYWGPSDIGLGFMERFLSPLKNAFKPTYLAHPEAIGSFHPSQLKHPIEIPGSMAGSAEGITTEGYVPEVESPTSWRAYLSDSMASLTDVFGIQGFAIGGLKKALSGGQSFITPNAMHEHSGRILSMQRMYWDESLGGVAGASEGYRRLNPDRPYATEYISAPIRNTMPSWMPEDLQYGDPYAMLPMGELRLPGRGFEALHPELRGVNYEDYPSVYKMQILNDIAPRSSMYYMNQAIVEQQISEGGLNDTGVNLYNEILRQRKERDDGQQYHYEGAGIVSDYALALKKFGRAIPTEALFPISPVHKFMGPVDPLGEYKSFVLMDKQFKLWEHPYEDYIKPAINRTVDALAIGTFIPEEAKEQAQIESYFSGMRLAKNQLLEVKAKEAAEGGNYEEASYFRSGIRRTLQGTSPLTDLDTLSYMLPQREERFLKGLYNTTGDRNKVLQSVSPEVQQILAAHWQKQALIQGNDIEGLTELQRNTPGIMGSNGPIEYGDNVPDRDFVGYAPGVDLNAFKLKVVNNMGKNIRDYGLWREDERKAQILDSMLNEYGLNIPFMRPELDSSWQDQAVRDYVNSIGMKGAKIVSVPTNGYNTASLNVRKNNENDIREKMKELGWIRM